MSEWDHSEDEVRDCEYPNCHMPAIDTEAGKYLCGLHTEEFRYFMETQGGDD